MVENILKSSHVDLIFGTHNIHRLPELLEGLKVGAVVEVWDEAEVSPGEDPATVCPSSASTT